MTSHSGLFKENVLGLKVEDASRFLQHSRITNMNATIVHADG